MTSAAAHVDTLIADVGGARLHYTVRGSGPTVVFVHGSLGELGDWEAQAAAFAPHYRVVTYSRRFHPPNDPPPAGAAYSVDQNAEDLAALIRAVGGAPVHVVGHSYGAYTALRMTLNHPELVRSLVLAEPPILGWLPGTPDGDSISHAFVDGTLPLAGAAFARGDSVSGLRIFLDAVSRPGYWDALPADVRAQLASSYGKEMRAELTTPLAQYMTPVSCDAVHALPMPVLLVTGAQSPRLFHVIADKLHGCLASPDTLVVPDARHNMIGKDAFVAGVLDFVGRH